MNNANWAPSWNGIGARGSKSASVFEQGDDTLSHLERSSLSLQKYDVKEMETQIGRPFDIDSDASAF